MASAESPYADRRRGERVLIRIPVKISAQGADGQHVNEACETVVVSRYGALLRVSLPLKRASTIELMNGFTQEVEKFRVVWVSEKPKDGKHDAGIELVTARENFWGVSFPTRAPRP